jgi:two-component system sensor histidine kinase YesM
MNKGEAIMFQRMLRRFSDTSLKIKLLLILFCFLAALGTIQGLFLYLQSSKLVIASERQKDQFELRQIGSNMDAEFNEIDILTKDLVYRSNVQQILKDDNADPQLFWGITHQRSMLGAINSVIVSYSFRIQSINIYDMDGNFYGAPGKDSNISYPVALYADFYQRIKAANGKMVTGPKVGNNLFAIGRLINSRESFTPIGILIISVRLDTLHGYYDEFKNNGNTKYLLFDQFGSSMNIDANNTPVYQNLLNHEEGMMNVEGQPYLISIERLQNYGWRLVKLTSKSSLLKSVSILKQATLINLLAVFAFFFPLSMFISARITRPIKILSNLMLGTIKKNFNNRAQFQMNDEIGRLSQAYNIMIDEINHLIQNEYGLRLMNKENELKMLQSQINPHFLYNTLDTINWAARTNGIDEVGELAESLAKLMRIAIRNDGQRYTVKDELDYIMNYFSIQKYRYEDRIDMHLDIDPDVLECYIPKLIVQPLVENAIVHNMETNADTTTIRLSIRREDNQFIGVWLSDDGVGISEARLIEIRKAFTAVVGIVEESHGLLNVHRRLMLDYGMHCGLIIHKLDKGTCIQFRFPSELKRGHQDVQAVNL